jgi:hypothetical protein
MNPYGVGLFSAEKDNKTQKALQNKERNVRQRPQNTWGRWE